MKTSIFLATLLLSLSAPAFAESQGKSRCRIKQENAASFQAAQRYGTSVQNVQVLSFNPGPWTEAMGNNTGYDTVTVQTDDGRDHVPWTETYFVHGKQLGSSRDCEITKVEDSGRQ